MNNIKEMRDFFADIPEDKWCVGELNGPDGTHCAMGHLDELYGGMYNEDTGLFCRTFHDVLRTPGYTVNNGKDPGYQQATPKLRILAALDDIIAIQEGDHAIKEVQSIVNQPVELELV